jgi:3-deoxy-D-manno-octulosonic-acid transferase
LTDSSFTDAGQMPDEADSVDILGGAYLATVSLAGSFGRALSKGLPDSFKARLEARAPFSLKPGWVWLHAVSVGELLLASGLIKKLREAGRQTHITTGTQAGMELLKARLPDWGGGSGQLTGGGFPLDDMRGLKSFFETPPGLFIALETEIWPNLFKELQSRSIPICVVNGRLTARTLDSRFKPWLRRAASRLSLVAARDPESAGRFTMLGAPNVVLGGNLKADMPPPPRLHDGWKKLQAGWTGAPVIVAGNTVSGEEDLILAAWKHAREKFPSLRLIIAPRQPKRFDSAAKLLSGEGVVYQRASGAWDLETSQWDNVQALLLDTMGELASVYSLGNVALVGGGWCWHGGHNPIEPLYWGVPTLIGSGYANFEDLVEPLLEAGCLQAVIAEALGGQILSLLAQIDPAGQRADAIKIPESLQGCLQRTWGYLEPYLPAQGTKNSSSFFRSSQC